MGWLIENNEGGEPKPELDPTTVKFTYKNAIVMLAEFECDHDEWRRDGTFNKPEFTQVKIGRVEYTVKWVIGKEGTTVENNTVRKYKLTGQITDQKNIKTK